MELAPSNEATERVFKGLSDAKTRLDQATQDEASYPDLVDQLNAQSEPQNYFFEPYASQWTPQVAKKGSIITLPGVVAAALDDTKTLSLSGLLPDIRSAWTSVDARLFLWSYAQRGRFAAKEFDQAIVAVGLVAYPAPGVFTSKVRHVLVVATTVEVVLLAVVADDNQAEKPDGAGQLGSFKLQGTRLSVSTDKCVVRRIVTTRNGRIFFGGSDGALYEILYAPDQKAAADRNSLLGAALTNVPGIGTSDGCRKIVHTSTYAQYLPKFLAGLASAPGKVVDMCVDHTRHILYVLHADAQVSVFDLGIQGDETKAVCAVNLLVEGAKYARENRRTRVSCPDERLFQPAVTSTSPPLQLVALATVSPDESKVVTLVAITSNGIRFYLTAFSRRYAYSPDKAKRPSSLEILHIRLPPPAISLHDAPPYHAKEGMQPGYAPGKSPSAVHVAFHRKGVFLCIQGRRDEQDQLVSIVHDPIRTTALPIQTSLAARKPTIRESVSLDTCIGKVVEVQEMDPYSSQGPESLWRTQALIAAAEKSSLKGSSSGNKRSFDEMTSGSLSANASIDAPVVGEMALMYSQPSRHFMCLTNAGIQVFKKIRPLDQLHRALLLSRGHELKAALVPFVRCFGEIQVICMLIALACGIPTDPLVSETSTAASLVAPRPSNLATIKSDDYIYTVAVQCIFEIAQGPPDNVPVEPVGTSPATSTSSSTTSTRIVLTTEFGMSYQHDGLVAFISRVLRPLWTAKSLGRRVVTRVSPTPSNDIKPIAKAPTNVTSYENIHSAEKLDEIREVLFQLKQLMENAGPFAVAITSGAARENNPSLDGVVSESAEAGLSRVSELVMRHQKSLTEDQLKRETRFKAEQRSLYYLYHFVLRSIEAISLLRIAQDHKVSLEEPLARLNFSELVTTTEGAAAAKTMTKALMRGRNENNQVLIKQLREQCPTYFSVSDLLHYQGYRSLSNAKLSGSPVSRLNFLKESLDQFLNSCHMWDTEDCLDVLQTICDDYMSLNYYEGVVKLSLACAKHFHDAAASDLSGTKSAWKRRCFGCILLALHRLLSGKTTTTANDASPQAVEEMVQLDDETRTKCVEELFHFALASEDASFHTLLYTWLYERGHVHLLTSIRSSFIEEFLKEKDQDLLVKLYMDQQKYLLAAKVWWMRAHEDCIEEDEYTTASSLAVAGNPDLSKRQYYVSKALGCLKSLQDGSEATEAIQEVSDVLDVLQLQMRVLKALEQKVIEAETSVSLTTSEELDERKLDVQLLTFKLYDASTLYNRFASKYNLWTECLHIIYVCKSEEADVIATLWRKIIFSLVPLSSTNAGFNAWRSEQLEKAGIQATTSSGSGSASFENGHWIGQMQSLILRLGKTFYVEGNSTYSTVGMGSLVFPVPFLADVLEWISLWYSQITGVGPFTGSSPIEVTTFHWVLRLFLDVGVPHKMLLSYYEQLYRDQPKRLYREGWTLHLLQAMLAIIVAWKKHAVSPRAGRDQLADFAACCPSIVDLCDDFITDLRATSQDENGKYATLRDQFRRIKGELVNFRTLM